MFFSQADWMDDVLQQVRSLASDSQQQEAAAAGEAESVVEPSSASERSRKKQRTSAEEALQVFREVMSEPRTRNLPSTVDEFFKQLALSDAQIQGIIALLPAAAQTPSFLLLFGLEEAELLGAGLAGVQVRAWQNAASKLI